jgi:hypothetical protein
MQSQQPIPPQQPVQSQQPMPPQQFMPPQPPPPVQPAARPRRKRHIGCWIFLFLLLAIAGTVLYFVAKFIWLPPKDLGIRYTQADFDSAMQKIGLHVDFEGKSSAELTQLIKENRDKRVPIDQYKWDFSNYEERSFQLTPQEVTAFINEVAPPFSWFEDVQVKVLAGGRTAGSYRVRFDKIKTELIPDVADMIPKAISRYLPNTFNLYMEGSFVIKENEIIVTEKLDRLDVGAINMQPVIEGITGQVTDELRDTIFNYVERIYKQIPDLVIHSLKINNSGNYEISAYMPTKVTVTSK